MMMLQRLSLRDFTKERYLAVAKLFPAIKKEQTQMYLMLSLTFLSLSFLGLFAINPTVVTIIELNKKLEDSMFVSEALQTKLANLSSLNTQYEELQQTLPLIDAAVPDIPKAAYLLGQMQTLAKKTGVKVVSVQVFEVELTKQKKAAQDASFIYSITVEGDTQKLLEFVQIIPTFDRVVAIESLTFTHEEKQSLTIRARAFFTP